MEIGDAIAMDPPAGSVSERPREEKTAAGKRANAFERLVRSRAFRVVFDDYNALMEWNVFQRDEVMFRDLRRLRHQVRDYCPRLAAVRTDDGRLVDRVVPLRQKVISMRVMVLVFVTVITAIYVAVIRSIHRQEDVSLDMKFWSVVVASTVLGLTIIWFAVRRIRFVGRDALISQLFSLCVLLEMNKHMFDKPNFKRALNRRIEACARRIEILPLTFGAEGDPATRMELGLLAGQIATHFRKNKILVVKGGQDRYQCLLTAMLEALSQISQNKWFELPTAPCAPSRRASRTSRAGWIGLFILGLMALLAVAYCGTTGDLGVSVAGVLIPILGVFLTFSLTKLGVKITALKQVAEVSTQIAKAG